MNDHRDAIAQHLNLGQTVSRRRALRMLGGLGVGAALVTACRPTGGGSGTTSTTTSGSCALTPEMTEGPYYLDLDMVRRDITEGRPGTPLALKLTVVDATCKPITNAAVDIWHSDALGSYSGVSGASGTYMRGTQITNSNGVCRFNTVYPGWYQGRTVHIHVKVHVGGVNGNVVHTGQLFFREAVTTAVYRSSPYKARGTRTTLNSDDNIYANGGSASTLVPHVSGSGYAASMTLAVRKS